MIDAIPVRPDSPQEDELALAAMTDMSFYHGIYFPSRLRERFDRAVFLDGLSEQEVEAWIACAKTFTDKAYLDQGERRLLIKNPVYTARVALLRRIWPDARFIHIRRDPMRVYQSSVRFYRTLLDQFALQPSDQVDVKALVLESYPRMMERLQAETAGLPADVYVDVPFEQFEAEPVPVVLGAVVFTASKGCSVG